MRSFSQLNVENNETYRSLLVAVSKLSGLFSESNIPFINYRVVENIFCKSFNVANLSRSDTAFDANWNSMGIGLKTFACPDGHKNEKIAEFNSLSRELTQYKGEKLARKLAYYRNERINLAKRLYDINHSIYHIVARRKNELLLFETDYETIDIDAIRSVKETKVGLQFEDGKNRYGFNRSKTTLFRTFFVPEDARRIPVEIIADPYALLLRFFGNEDVGWQTTGVAQEEFVILPLYGHLKNGQKFVFEKSGLNQWNASGRKRDFGEVYIPIPAEVHRRFPGFFPKRDEHFHLQIPTGETFSAKVCQDSSKALMTNPNNKLSDWLLRKVFGLEEGELLTIDKINKLGFDSVRIAKTGENYKIDKAKLDSYENFVRKQTIRHIQPSVIRHS